MKKIWFDEAWDDYIYWQQQDKKTLKRINILLKDIELNFLIITRQLIKLSRYIKNHQG